MALEQSIHLEGMRGRGPWLPPSEGRGEQDVQGGVALSVEALLCGSAGWHVPRGDVGTGSGSWMVARMG